jgi:hypothetical protein
MFPYYAPTPMCIGNMVLFILGWRQQTINPHTSHG